MFVNIKAFFFDIGNDINLVADRIEAKAINIFPIFSHFLSSWIHFSIRPLSQYQVPICFQQTKLVSNTDSLPIGNNLNYL